MSSSITVFADHAAWLEGRGAFGGYGGSDIATIVGQNPYKSSFELFAQRTGKMPDIVANEAMESGQFLEAGILNWHAAKEGVSVLPFFDSPAIFRRDDNPLAQFSPDGFVLSSSEGEPLPKAWLEPLGFAADATPFLVGGIDAKNHAERVLYNEPVMLDGQLIPTGYGAPGSGDVPRYIWWQCQWGCYVCGAPHWDIAAAFGGQKRLPFRVHRDDAAIELACELVEEFHVSHVLLDVAPTVSRSALEKIEDAVKALHPRDTIEKVNANSDDIRTALRFHVLQRILGPLLKLETAYQNAIKLRLGEAGAMVIPGAGKAGKDLEVFTYRKSQDGAPVIDWKATALRLADRLDDPDAALRECEVLAEGRRGSRSLLAKMKAAKRSAEILSAAAANELVDHDALDLLEEHPGLDLGACALQVLEFEPSDTE